jgi:hypothetical protein
VILENGQLITTFDTKTIQQWKDPSYIESTEF